MERNEPIDYDEIFELDSDKAIKGATYKQYRLLEKLENVSVKVNGSQFLKRCERIEASALIDKALKGIKICIE